MKQVQEFEEQIAEYFGARYAVATDCCTHAIELCARLLRPKNVEVPSRTYLSIPMTMTKLNINWRFNDRPWSEYYWITNTNIVDAATMFRPNSYVQYSYMCLSFQFKKHLNLGRGGMILLDDYESYRTLKKMRYDGRDDDLPWAHQNVDTMGYHYYMTPETAQLGLDRLAEAIATPARIWSDADYPNLRNMKVFDAK